MYKSCITIIIQQGFSEAAYLGVFIEEDVRYFGSVVGVVDWHCGIPDSQHTILHLTYTWKSPR